MSRDDYLAGKYRSPQDMNIQPAPAPHQTFSPQDMNIQPASPHFSPQDMNIQPAPAHFSPQDMNIQPAPAPITPHFSPQDMNIQPAPPPPIISDDSGVITNGGKKGKLPIITNGDTNVEISTSESDDGPDPKDKRFKKPADLLEIFNKKGKKGLTETQLVRIVNLLAANKRNKNVLNPEQEKAFSGLFGENYANALEEKIQSYRGGYPNYFADKSPTALGGAMGLWDSVTAGEVRPDGSLTLSGLEKDLSTSDKAWLKVNRPDLYYGGSNTVTTMPGLAGRSMDDMQDLARLSITDPEIAKYPELVRRIVEARNITDPKTRYTGLGSFTGEEPWVGDKWDSQGNYIGERSPDEYRQQVSYGEGIPSLYGGPIQDPFNPGAGITPFKPGVDPDNPLGLPEEYMGWYDSPFNTPGAGGKMIVPVTLPDGTVVNMPDTHSGSQFQQYLDSLGGTTQAAATTPMPFDYSQWPQFTSAYPGHYSNWAAPSYAADGGIVSQARPQYDYWNRIANAYPGMR